MPAMRMENNSVRFLNAEHLTASGRREAELRGYGSEIDGVLAENSTERFQAEMEQRRAISAGGVSP